MFQTQPNLITCIKAICLTSRANTRHLRMVITHTHKSQRTQPSLLWNSHQITTSKRDSSCIERSRVLLIRFCNQSQKLKILIGNEGKKSQHQNQEVRRNGSQSRMMQMGQEVGAKAEVSLVVTAIVIPQGHQND